MAVEIPFLVAGVPVTVIGEVAVQGNATITTLVIPDSVVVVYDRAFRGMSALESAKLGNGVTNVGDSAFQGSSRLATVSIGSRVTTIGNHSFVNNASLARVRFVGNAPHVGTDAFAGVAAGAKAIRAANLTGHGRSGSIWKNLIVTPPGRIAVPTVTVAPLEIGDLNDGDNMHDLSFPAIPAGAKLLTITLPGRHVEDPNGDPNPAQVFRFRKPDFAPLGRSPARR